MRSDGVMLRVGMGSGLRSAPPTHSCRQGHNVACLTLMPQTTVSARVWIVDSQFVNYHNALIMDCKMVSFEVPYRDTACKY